MRLWFFLICISGQSAILVAEPTVSTSASRPENVTLPGHSMQGEAFDEGPRRAATLLGTTGRVTFPITSEIPLAQQFFNQGIGQLHGFWYFEAERSFRQAAKLDPECAMAYLGMSLANVNNEQRAKGFLVEAVKRKARASGRERMYIDAFDTWYQAKSSDDQEKRERAKNYVKAIEEILYRFPDDLEAKAMLGLALWQRRDDLNSVGEFATDALLNDVLAVNSYHPAHHYRVHLWDNDKASMALNSAERCGLSAPGIAHMWHMSGHTYSELYQYFDAAWHQEAAARTDHAYMMREGIFPDRIHNFAHNNEWLGKNLQYLGRVHDAIALARNAIELPRHPKWNSLSSGKSAHFGRMRLLQIYSQFELWDQLVADAQTRYLEPSADEAEQIKYFRFLGRAEFRRNNRASGLRQLAVLEHRLKRLTHETNVAIEAATAKAVRDHIDAKGSEAARDKSIEPFSERKKALERAIDEFHGYLLLAEGKPLEALDRLKKAEDVDESFLADVELRVGKGDESIKRLRDFVSRSKNQVRPLAALVEMLWRQEKKDEARQTFEAIRQISGSIDLEVPPFVRLSPIAAEFGFGSDWRKPKPVARNAAELPELSTLGPFLWQPTEAPQWSLPDGSGQQHSLAEFRGRPIVVIFYLGYGCLHCAEQLQAFAPKQKEYADAGISLVAISSDSVQNLRKAQDQYRSAGDFPFQIVSDSTLEAFKRYRAYDDFEESPLHATILIDGAGKIRWHDSGAVPFMDVDFLLEEAKRLLNPERMELPQELPLNDETAPADALAPQNSVPGPNHASDSNRAA